MYKQTLYSVVKNIIPEKVLKERNKKNCGHMGIIKSMILLL